MTTDPAAVQVENSSYSSSYFEDMWGSGVMVLQLAGIRGMRLPIPTSVT